MKSRRSLLFVLLIATTPAAVAAQAESSPLPGAVDRELVGQLCEVTAADAAELADCVASVEAALARMDTNLPDEGRSLLGEATELVDQTLEDLRQIDVEAALDDAIGSIEEFELDIDVQGAIDDAVAALEDLDLGDVDVQGVIEGAVAEALAATEDFDLRAAVDQALTEAQVAIEEADLQGTVDEAVAALEERVAEAQAIVAEAQRWARENRDAVCRGGSVSLGTTVGIAVFAVTGVEWLGIQAFWATERFTNATCGDVVGE